MSSVIEKLKNPLCEVNIVDFPRIPEIAVALIDGSVLEFRSGNEDFYKAKVQSMAVEGGSFWTVEGYLTGPEGSGILNSKFYCSFYQEDKIRHLYLGRVCTK